MLYNCYINVKYEKCVAEQSLPTLSYIYYITPVSISFVDTSKTTGIKRGVNFD